MGVAGLVHQCGSSSSCCRTPSATVTASDDWLKSAARAMGTRVSQSAVDPVRGDRRPALHSDDDLRHGLGRPLPAGGARVRLRVGGDALGDGASRLDHRLPAARFHLGSARPAQAGDHRGRVSSCWPVSRWILYGPPGRVPALCRSASWPGSRSGAAMLPYTVIKEANPPEMSGTATGVVNFLNFTFSALLGPVFGWILMSVSGGAAQMALEHYQTAFEPSPVRRRAGHRSHAPLEGDGPAADGRRPGQQQETRHEPRVRNGKVRTAAGEVRGSGAGPDRGRPSLRGDGAGRRHRGRREGADRADSRRPGRQDPGNRQGRAGSTSGRRGSSTLPTAMPRPPRPWSWSARGEAELLMKGSLHTDELLGAVVAQGDGPAHGAPHQPRVHHGRADLSQGADRHRCARSTSRRRWKTRSTSARTPSIWRCRSASKRRRSRFSPRSRRSPPRCRPPSTPRRCARWPTRADHGRHARRPAGVRQRHQQGGGARPRASSRRSPAIRTSCSRRISRPATSWPSSSASWPTPTAPVSCSAPASRSS